MANRSDDKSWYRNQSRPHFTAESVSDILSVNSVRVLYTVTEGGSLAANAIQDGKGERP